MSGRAEVTELVEQTARYLSDCFRSESPPRASELAARLGLSPVQLSRAFTQSIGIPPALYLKWQQVEFAKRLLKQTTLTTNQVAYRAGFGTRATFFRLFREFARATPRRFARR
jgi:AraC family transcriptional regulator of adaptative response / DNA-3-methyladenine glycosylase II